MNKYGCLIMLVAAAICLLFIMAIPGHLPG
jgi:hypothetical protein